MTTHAVFPPLSRGRRRFIIASCAATILVGTAVLIGWAADIMFLKGVVAGWATMKPNTAVAFIFSGMALWTSIQGESKRRFTIASRILAGIVTLVGLLTMTQYLTNINFHIDQALFRIPSLPDSRFPVLRPAPATALLLTFNGLAIFLLKRGRETFVQALAVCALAAALVACFGYLFKVQSLYEIAAFRTMAIHTSVFGILLSAAIVAAAADAGPASLITADGFSGMFCRRMLAAALVIPILVGMLVLAASQIGHFQTAFAYALFTFTLMFVLGGAVLITSTYVRRFELDRSRVERELRESERRFHLLADSMPQVVWTARPDGTADYLNERWYEFTGLPRTVGDSAWRTAVHPEDLPRLDAAWSNAIRTGEFSQTEYRLLDRCHNAYRWHLSQEVAQRDAAGTIVRWFGTSTDIDSQKRTEEALKAGERRFRMLLEGMPQLVWTCDSQGRCDYLGPQWMTYTGVPEAQHLGYGWTSLLHPDDKEHLIEKWEEAVACGGPYDVEARYRNAAGEYRWFKTRAIRFHLDDGTLKWFGTNTDIHDQKIAEERLQASERLYRAIGESIDFGVWVCEADGRNTYASPSFLKLVGITQQQCSEFGWGDVLHPDDAADTIASWKACVQRRGAWYREHRFRGVDGNWHPVLAQGVPVSDDRGNLTCWAGINLDISRLKAAENSLRELNADLERRVAERTQAAEVRAAQLARSEERFRLLLRGVTDYAIVMLDPEGNIASWNPVAETITGFSEDEIVGRSFSVLYQPHALTGEALQGKLRHALNHGRFEEEGPRVRKDGTQFWAAVTMTPLFDERRNHIGFVKVTRDVTERRQVEAERRQALLRTRFVEQTMAAREEEQRRIGRDLHDGVGQSLTSLRLALRVIEEAPTLERAREAARELRPIVVQAQDEVRRIARNLRPRVLDDLGLIPALDRLIAEITGVNDLEVRLDAIDIADLRLPDAVETALYRIAQEALTNVAKHANASVVEIRLDRDESGIRLTVADDGIGFDPTTTKPTDQAQFGLAGMRERAVMLKGTFEVDAAPNEGTTIRVTIPSAENLAA